MSENRKRATQQIRNKSVLKGTGRKHKILSEMAASPAKRLRRTQKKPDRFGKRLSASSRNEFFGQVSSNSDTDDTSNRNVIS